ncbi:4Fe-4S dicluster domain-containing protein [Edwardsiella piscicida]|uniref:sulfate reduction electron transfer complex DsrMKJOP subunit DsrO n=1 Tax=Edwardsiella piscicida TaxID=1263550 RepID=UPI0010A6025B|nr:4Fe-4S dicluster domain-containing protein [Edwardsiella piscicida]
MQDDKQQQRRRLLLGIGSVSAGLALLPWGEALAAQSPAETASRQGMRGKRWAMIIDLRKCVGCQACTVACCMENLPPIGQFRTTVKQYEVSGAAANGVSQMFMLPRLCNHCENPPCVAVCPVQATYQRDDGIVMVDNRRCVGCAYCIQACPYDARFINQQTLTADKCTFCAHRLEAGLLPACVESCVGGARIIGDMHDPDSTLSRLLAQHRASVYVLKPEQHTAPRVFYLGLDAAFVSQVSGQAALYGDEEIGE